MTSEPIIIQPIEDILVIENAIDDTRELFEIFDDPFTTGLVASFQLFDTSLGNGGLTEVVLFDQDAPLSVENFLRYVEDGRYVNSIIHRSIPGFVVQGGGFTVDDFDFPDNLSQDIPTFDFIENEFSEERSNLRGTIAYAKSGQDITVDGRTIDSEDTATSQWFFNLSDNSANLDNQNGGFTVFGEVLSDADLETVDAIAALDVFPAMILNPAFSDLPLIVEDPSSASPGNIEDDNFVRYQSITVSQQDELQFSIFNNSNPDLVTVSINEDQLVLDYQPEVTGTADITVRATNLFGNTIDETFTVTVEEHADDSIQEAEVPDSTRTTVTGINFLGEAVFETGFQLGGTEVGGISGLVYDENNQVYYAISDDRSENAPARFYNVTIDLSDGSLEDGDVEFVGERTLLDGSGNPFPEGGIDPEGIALTSAGTLFISSEGNANDLLAPFVNEFSLEGEQLNQLPVPEKFLPTEDGTSGIRNNQAFESLTITPDERFLYTAVENALIQDGPASSLDSESAVRIIEYDLETGEPSGEFIYINDRIPVAPEPPDSFADNGLVELLALDNSGTFLALERSFAMGVGINLRLYEIQLQGATDVRDFDSLLNPDPEEELFDVDAVASKRLLLDFGELGIQLDNSEALAFGPTLDNGNQSLIVVSDNNFNESQITQFLAFELELNHIPAVTAAVETPPEIRFGDPENPDPNNAPDSDDPAIYLHPTDSGESIVITTVKNGGLRVYDLEGNELQRIAPDGIRYNNVDLIYDFSLGETTVDLAVASDRANDTLAIFQIDPNTRQLTDITAGSLSDAATSIFGVDDGEQTAYGLATYTSLVSDKSYVFVSQANGNQVAQLELVDNGSGAVDATVVRTLTVPVPPEADLEDAQVEGMVVDRELGFLYAGQEDFGIWKFSAEPDAGDNAVIVDTINDVGEGERRLEGDVEGLTIYYGEDGNGYLLASSQGDSTFAVYDRGGSNSYLGSFAMVEGDGIDGVEESDGADILSTPLGEQFPFGLLVVQDGSNEAQVTFQDPDDGEIQNFNTNFKYIGLEELAETLNFLDLEPEAFDPRNIELPSVELVFGSPGDDELEAGVTPGFDGEDALVFTGAGEDLIDLSLANSPSATLWASGTRIYSGSDEDELFAGEDDRLFGGEGDDILDASVGEGGNRLYGGEGNDELYAGKDDRLFGGEGDDILDASVGEGGNRLYGGDGNDSFFLGEGAPQSGSRGDRLVGGEGDDSFFVGTGGDNIITGGEGVDAFWIANSEFPEAVNTITDFEPGIDVIGIGGDLGIAAVDVSFNPVEGGVIIAAGGNDLAELLGVDASLLGAADVDGDIIIA